MRIASAAVLCLALTGCVSSPPPPPPVPIGLNPEHDAHCRSLMMGPGTLVYVQCRLAMSETQRESEVAGRNALVTQLGPLTPPAESALRDDVFCNFNESAKASMQPVDAVQGAVSANGLCGESRRRLERELRAANPVQADLALADYTRVTIATNEATITESRAFR